jgi:hypothetical protein
VRYDEDLSDPAVAKLAIRDADDRVWRADLLLSHLRSLSMAAQQTIGAEGDVAAD